MLGAVLGAGGFRAGRGVLIPAVAQLVAMARTLAVGRVAAQLAPDGQWPGGLPCLDRGHRGARDRVCRPGAGAPQACEYATSEMPT